MKKFTLLIVIALCFCFTSVAFASFTDVPQGAIYEDAIKRLTALGIISGSDNGQFRPNDVLTREQFAKMMVISSGLEDTAKSFEGSTIFPDVEASSWSSGYINTALNKGYITGGVDGKFHPKDSITFAQACTILVKALGYTDTDVPGLWPRNYIEKAKTLGLTDGINQQNNDGLPRWAGVLMLDRLLSSNVKKTNPTDPDKTFADASGQYILGIVLGTPLTSDKLTDKQVLTDKGTYYISDSLGTLKLGSRYKFIISGNKILSTSQSLDPVVEISVDSVVDTTITYRNQGITKSLTLPDKTTYYYNGVKQSYDNLKNVLQTRSSITFAYNGDATGYEYGVIFDPIYSKPEVALNFNSASKKLGNIDFTGYPRIVRSGKLIDTSGIEEKDVVYKVSDIWDRYRYFLVVDNKVEGTITAILPNKFSPKTIQIDKKDYELSKYISLNKINGTPGSFNVEEKATVLLGHDGKVVDVLFPESSDNSNFAIVLNFTHAVSTDLADYGKTKYTVKLLRSDGTTVTYNVNADPSNYKGKLVSYTVVTDKKDEDEVDTVALEELSYMDSTNGEYVIKKDDRMINSDYVTDNIKIFNIVSNEPSVDALASIVDWSSMPTGTILAKDVLYINTVGDFKDINVILINDLFDQQYKLGIVESFESAPSRGGGGSSYRYTLMVEGNEYTYTSSELENVLCGSVLKVKLKNSGVDSVEKIVQREAPATRIQALDTRRIKINNQVYTFKDNVAIYFKNTKNVLTPKGIDDIDTSKVYAVVSVYLDKPLVYGGKVEVLIITDL